MSTLNRHLIAAGLTALGLSWTPAGASAGAAGLTRAEVRQDLKDARATNRMTPAGEIGDTDTVLAAREAFYARQTKAKREKSGPDAVAQRTLDGLVEHLQALDADSAAIAPER